VAVQDLSQVDAARCAAGLLGKEVRVPEDMRQQMPFLPEADLVQEAWIEPMPHYGD
jgi:hypothetical protein